MNPKELINAGTLFTLGGASFGVTLLGNVANYMFKWNPRWLGFVVALVIAIASTSQLTNPKWTDWLVAVFQALQIYATAVGIAAVTGTASSRAAATRGSRGLVVRRRLWKNWFES